MAAINVPTTDTFEQWRVKTNSLSDLVGDGGTLSGQYTGQNLVDVVNEIKTASVFDNIITINDQALDATTELAGNAANMIVSTGGQTVLTMTQTGNLTVHADITSGNNMSVGANIGVTGTATIGSTTTSQGLVTANAGIDCNGNQDISGTLDVGGASTLNSLSVTNNTSIGGNLNITGTTTFGSTLNFGANPITTTGSLSVGGTTTTSINNTGNTTLGNANSDTVSFNARVNTSLQPSADNAYTLGTSALRWSTVHGVTFSGTATTANYADLAELYLSDFAYEAGTVVRVGGEFEITATDGEHNHSVLGVISAYPAYLMNNQLENGIPVALKGRVPVKVKGSVNKGDRLVGGPEGHAEANNDSPHGFAIALESFEAKKSGKGRYGIVEAVVL
ncbi:MAG: hypothetical protein CMH04_04155 [Marinovum sp.]|nr:hypothetical protein [Marinovum sp.]|tara:strand:- start:642 stop:1817 length:1176 start_codon:yes stop_codon:yes gene_type:complete